MVEVGGSRTESVQGRTLAEFWEGVCWRCSKRLCGGRKKS